MSDIEFGCFDRQADTRIHERNLPHWFQTGAAMFVTFRSLDSLPRDVILRWQRELEAWLDSRGLPRALAVSTVGRQLEDHARWLQELSQIEQKQFRKLANRLYHRALDECHGACLLKQAKLASIVGNAIRYYDGQKYDLDRFVVMPNHVHTILQFRSGQSLGVIGQSWMRYTARLINAELGRSGPFWQPEPFDHIIRSSDQFAYLQAYVAANPKKANLQSHEYLAWQRA